MFSYIGASYSPYNSGLSSITLATSAYYYTALLLSLIYLYPSSFLLGTVPKSKQIPTHIKQPTITIPIPSSSVMPMFMLKESSYDY